MTTRARAQSLTNLQKLDVSNNQIASVGPALGALTALEELNLSGNMIEASGWRCRRAGSLSCGARAQTLPNEIGRCRSLEIVDMNGNFLQKLPNDFTYCTRLLELNLVRAPSFAAAPR